MSCRAVIKFFVALIFIPVINLLVFMGELYQLQVTALIDRPGMKTVLYVRIESGVM